MNATPDVPMSERLERLLRSMYTRNVKAAILHVTADALRDAGHVTPADEQGDRYDWQMRRFFESGLCWRDTDAGGRLNRFSALAKAAA